MAPSPRKTASPPPTFQQTWDDTDAAFLDPTSLPIIKAPRAWDRKQETKVTGDGRQKKVWRRCTTRARGANTTSDPDDQVPDARSRAVKKLQHMSPKAMEKTAAMRHVRKRAFKATRWERRKSVLPRKKAMPIELGPEIEEDVLDGSDDEQDATGADSNNNSFSEVEMSGLGGAASIPTLPLEEKRRRSTFTFSIDEEQAEVSTFASDSPPVSHESLPQQVPEGVEYPELPQFVEAELQATVATMQKEDEPIQATPESTLNDTLTDAGTLNQNFEETKTLDCTNLASSNVEMQQCQEEKSDMGHDLIERGEILYPSLPANKDTPDLQEQHEDEDSDDLEAQETSTDEEVTEASMQLDIQQVMEEEQLQEQSAGVMDTLGAQPDSAVNNRAASEDVIPKELAGLSGQDMVAVDNQTTVEPHTVAAVDNETEDIAAGLTLGVSTPSSREPTPRKLRSPSPPPREPGMEDTTMTIGLDDDTALLKDFLSRAAASKASKAATISRRESLQNRRDSDVVRHALASPRKVLEDKDPNSPSKCDNDATFDLSQTLTLSMDAPTISSPSQEQTGPEEAEEAKGPRSSRRSSRTRKTRLPSLLSAQPSGPSKIAVRRADGGEPIVLKKTDAQELSLLTRANTRKNKQGAATVSLRLLKLANEARTGDDSTIDSTASLVPIPGKKYVRWDEQLAYFQEGTDTTANMLAEAESLSTPDELSIVAPESTPSAKSKPKSTKDKNSTPKVRRVRGLGTTNGTPGKGLLAPGSLLPDEVQEEMDTAQAQPQRLPRQKASKKMSIATSSDLPTDPKLLPMLDVAPVGIEPPKDSQAATKERKSKLATLRKVKLPQPTSTVPADGKENQKRNGISSPAKKGIPRPSMIVPPSAGLSMETGLPRRRARKM